MIEENAESNIDLKGSVETEVSMETKDRLQEESLQKESSYKDLFVENEKQQVFETQINSLINYINLSIQDMDSTQENVLRNFSVFDQSNFKIKKEVKYEIEDHINANIPKQRGLQSLFQDVYQEKKEVKKEVKKEEKREERVNT